MKIQPIPDANVGYQKTTDLNVLTIESVLVTWRPMRMRPERLAVVKERDCCLWTEDALRVVILLKAAKATVTSAHDTRSSPSRMISDHGSA